MIYTQFSRKQLIASHWWLMDRYRGYDALICDGAIRSGKTLSMTLGFLAWSLAEYDGQIFAITGKTIESLKRNIVIHLRDWFEGVFHFNENIKQNRLEVTDGNHTNTYYLFGGKDEGSAALIQGMTLAGVLFDEVALQPRSFVEQAIARCSVDGARFWFNCNPDSPAHWFHLDWVKRCEEKNALRLHFKMEDNLSLSDEKREQYDRLFTGVFRQRYIEGEWVKAEGVIYRHFVDNIESFVVDTHEPLQLITIGIDYGASKSSTSFKATGISNGFKCVYSLAERDLDGIYEPDEIYRQFEDFYLHIEHTFGTCYNVYADYGALGQILTNGLQRWMQTRGYPVQVGDCSKGRILDRILFTTQLMSQGRYKVLRDCPRLIGAFRDAVWDERHEDTRLDDGTSDIDSLDAFEYSIYPFHDRLVGAI